MDHPNEPQEPPTMTHFVEPPELPTFWPGEKAPGFVMELMFAPDNNVRLRAHAFLRMFFIRLQFTTQQMHATTATTTRHDVITANVAAIETTRALYRFHPCLRALHPTVLQKLILACVAARKAYKKTLRAQGRTDDEAVSVPRALHYWLDRGEMPTLNIVAERLDWIMRQDTMSLGLVVDEYIWMAIAHERVLQWPQIRAAREAEQARRLAAGMKVILYTFAFVMFLLLVLKLAHVRPFR
ncbi:hypothetical protein B0T19DRAFT_446186 [Cercophora scortea]|uniref:Uncharacterized protein n=1 Tax=Cercophora scortea TaxID=314031 RepID=A0AAE0I287_9PEZI|nr:hypothetical protein B0T19DRAFT_446186 [Cercophora scortea]